MMAKDSRAKTVKILIGTGDIKEFREIFETFPKTTLADELGIHFNRMSRMIDDVTTIKVSDIYLIAAYFDIDPKVLFALIDSQKGKGKKK